MAVMFGVASCGDDGGTNCPVSSDTKRTVLIYAVASNNLSSYLEKDVKEMIAAAPSVDGLSGEVRVLLYSVASKSADVANLAELVRDAKGQWCFQNVKSYDRNTFSTDPERISEVISDLREIAPAPNYGLVFWSHATAGFLISTLMRCRMRRRREVSDGIPTAVSPTNAISLNSPTQFPTVCSTTFGSTLAT